MVEAWAGEKMVGLTEADIVGRGHGTPLAVSLSLIIRYKYVQQPPIYTKDYANSSYDRNLVVAHVFLGLCCGLICACYVVLSGSLRKAWKRKKYNRRKRLRCVDIT